MKTRTLRNALLPAVILSVLAAQAEAQFGIGSLRNTASSLRGNSTSTQGRNLPRITPRAIMPSPPVGFGMRSGPSIGETVGGAVISTTMGTLRDRMGTVIQPRATTPSQQRTYSGTFPNAGVVVASGAQQTSGNICVPPQSQSSIVVAQTPVQMEDTVIAAPSAAADEDGMGQIRTLIADSKKLFRQQKYQEAIVQLDQAVQVAPENSDILQFRGFAYFAIGDFDSAAADVYDAFMHGNSWNWQAVYDLYQSKERYEEQLRALEKTRRTSPSMSSHFLLAYQYLVLDHMNNGKRELNAALEFQPEEPLLVQLVAAIDQRIASESAESN